MTKLLLVVIVALFAGDAVASDASWGTLRSVLTRPVRRGRLLAAKVESLALLGVVVMVIVSVTALVAGVVLFGWHPLNLGGVHQSISQILGNLALASLYVLWGTAGFAAFAFMASTMVDSPVLAGLAGIGLAVVSLVLDGISTLGSVRFVLPTHYSDAWTSLFSVSTGGPTSDMLWGTLLQMLYVLVFAGIAWRHFQRKDIRS